MSAPVAPLVVHVVHRLDVGGLENGVVNLVNHIPSRRFRQAIICLAGFSPKFRTRIRRADVEVVSLDKRRGKDLPVYGRMWKVLRRMGPALVHTRNLGTVDMQWIAAAAGVRVRLHGEHGWEADDPSGMNPRNLRIRQLCRPAIHGYVPMSRDGATWLERAIRVPRTRIHQIYNGVDTERFNPRHRNASPFGWAEWEAGRTRRIVVGTVGRLDPVKSQSSLLRAMRAVVEQRPGISEALRIVIAGDGPLRQSLEKEADELGLAGLIWFAGSRADTPEILGLLDIFVLPSVNEGVSNTILEAMATGLPVIASRVGGNPELVLDGETGALYSPSDSSALTVELLRYIDDAGLRARHGDAGRFRAVREFSLQSMVESYAALYDRFLTPGAPDLATGKREVL